MLILKGLTCPAEVASPARGTDARVRAVLVLARAAVMARVLHAYTLVVV